MSVVTKAANALMDVGAFGDYPQGFGPSDPMLLHPSGSRIGPFIAGETLGNLAPCYIGSDGLVHQSTGAAVNAAAKVVGYCAGGAQSGASVYLCYNIVAFYGTGLTPGAFVYLGTSAGTLDSAPTTGGTNYIGICLDAQRIFLQQSTY